LALISTCSKLLLLLLLYWQRPPPLLLLLLGCRSLLQVGTAAATSQLHSTLPRQLCPLQGCHQQRVSSRRHVLEQG
jgi:hypothetical protein